LEIEYTDGSHETVVTDATWRVTDRGPTREADIIMGESYDARAELRGWCAGYDAKSWEPAIRGEENPRAKTVYHRRRRRQGDRISAL
jgi:alpha-L-rhamnosidase